MVPAATPVLHRLRDRQHVGAELVRVGGDRRYSQVGISIDLVLEMAEPTIERSFKQKRLCGAEAPQVENHTGRPHRGGHNVGRDTVFPKHRLERRPRLDQAADERCVRGEIHVPRQRGWRSVVRAGSDPDDRDQSETQDPQAGHGINSAPRTEMPGASRAATLLRFKASWNCWSLPSWPWLPPPSRQPLRDREHGARWRKLGPRWPGSWPPRSRTTSGSPRKSRARSRRSAPQGPCSTRRTRSCAMPSSRSQPKH